MSNEIELVYMAPFLGIEGSNTTPHYKYQKLRGGTDVNKRSKDKERYGHCYDLLEPGKCYVIVTRNYKPEARFGCWVFEECIEVPDAKAAEMVYERVKTLDPRRDVPGYQTTEDMLNRACIEVVRMIKIKQKLKETAALVNELLEY